MSAVRPSRSHRKTSRAAQSPYARPAAKKSSWSLTSLFSFLNPLRSRFQEDSSESLSSSSDDESFESSGPSPATASLSARGEQIANGLSTGSKPNAIAGPSSRLAQDGLHSEPAFIFGPPKTPARTFHLEESTSPQKNLEAVTNFLAERAGQQISGVEVEGLISLINKSTPPERPEPFRFTSSTPSTPARGNSPFLTAANGAKLGLTTPATQMTSQTPRKTLTKNPNGVYRWEGGGSSKLPRSRNRYSSPAFGPPRPTTNRIFLKDTQSVNEISKDTKRRRVGDDPKTSSASPSGLGDLTMNGKISDPSYRSSAPDPSPTRTAQALPFPVSAGATTPSRIPTAPKVNGVSSPNRLRPPALPSKPTVPVVPSPLRQAWSGASPNDSPPSRPDDQQRQTKAANFMAELIKEVTPPKRPDLSNPYQTASPVGKIGPPKRGGKRVRATGKPAPPINKDKVDEKGKLEIEDKEKGYSPQAIIEATLPKGSKRSRPPTNLEKTGSVPPTSEQQSPASSSKSRPPDAPKSGMSYIVEEAGEEDDEEKMRVMKKSKPRLNGKGVASTTKPQTAPPDITIEEIGGIDRQTLVSKPIAVSSSPAIHSTSATPSLAPPKSTSAPKEPSKLRYSYQPESGVSSTPPTPPSAPEPSFDSSAVPTSHVTEALISKAHNVTPSPPSHSPSAREAACTAPTDSLPSFTFIVRASVFPNTAQHLKARSAAQYLPKSELPSFDFIKPDLAKSTVPPVKAFDWAAAGLKPAVTNATVNWNCSTCMLSNSNSAVECTICGASR